MKKQRFIEGVCIPMDMDDINTDVIIPAQYLTQTSQAGYGQHAFKRLKENNSNFVLNQEKFSAATIMISGTNFGCGSSREHAVWAIQELGIQAIIAESFADIFRNNAQKNKLVLIEQPASICKKLMETAESSLNLYIDIQAASIQFNEQQLDFAIDPFFQHCLINGTDELDYLTNQLDAIKHFKQQQNNTSLFIQTP